MSFLPDSVLSVEERFLGARLANSRGKIPRVQVMTPMRPVPVDRQLAAEDHAQAELGDDLLWILPDPEDVIGPYADDRLSIRPQVTQDDHLGRCLGCRVGVSWIEWRVLPYLSAQHLSVYLV